MFLISCPFCGERDQSEFKAGGEAHIERPQNNPSVSYRCVLNCVSWNGRVANAVGRQAILKRTDFCSAAMLLYRESLIACHIVSRPIRRRAIPVNRHAKASQGLFTAAGFSAVR